MGPLKRLFARLRRATPEETPSGDDVLHRLLQLQRRHIFIDLTFPRLNQRFRSMVLELEPEAGHFVLDELNPAAPAHALLEGEIAEVRSASRELAVSFSSRFLGRELRDDEPVYLMELPADLHVSHNRTVFRVDVMHEPGLAIDFSGPDHQRLPARIVNLSTDGIKLRLPGDARAVFSTSKKELGPCLISIPPGHTIECRIDIRNHYFIRAPEPHTLAGGMLHIDNRQQAARLSQFLAAVQRRQRRSGARSG